MKVLRLMLSLLLVLFTTVTFAQMVDINTATAEQMEKGLKGIGPAKAAAIVKYRSDNGPFKAVDDLINVPGIGDKTVAGLKNAATVGGVTHMAPAMPHKPTLPSTAPVSVKTAAPPAAPAMAVKPITPPATVPPAPAIPAKSTTSPVTVPPTPAVPVKPKATVELPKQ